MHGGHFRSIKELSSCTTGGSWPKFGWCHFLRKISEFSFILFQQPLFAIAKGFWTEKKVRRIFAFGIRIFSLISLLRPLTFETAWVVDLSFLFDVCISAQVEKEVSRRTGKCIGHRSRPPLFDGNLSSRDVLCIDGLCKFSLKTPTLWLNDGDKRKWPRAKSASVNHRLVLKVVKPQASVTDGKCWPPSFIQIDKTVDTPDIIFFISSAVSLHSHPPLSFSSAILCHASLFRKTS